LSQPPFGLGSVRIAQVRPSESEFPRPTGIAGRGCRYRCLPPSHAGRQASRRIAHLARSHTLVRDESRAQPVTTEHVRPPCAPGGRHLPSAQPWQKNNGNHLGACGRRSFTRCCPRRMASSSVGAYGFAACRNAVSQNVACVGRGADTGMERSCGCSNDLQRSTGRLSLCDRRLCYTQPFKGPRFSP
jgi:hypothetical protein